MEEIHLIRENNVPWGMRLTGGRDFGTPLTIIKVVIGSLAEKAGLQVGDMLIKVNDQPLNIFTHLDAFNFIQNAGDDFKVSIIRGALLEHFDKVDQSCEEGVINIVNETSDIVKVSSQTNESIVNNLIETQEVLLEEKIINNNEIMLSESEVIIETSEVLKETEEEYENQNEVSMNTIEQSSSVQSQDIIQTENIENNAEMINENQSSNNNELKNNIELKAETSSDLIENENDIDPEVEHLNQINLRKTEEMLAQDKNKCDEEKLHVEKLKRERQTNTGSIPIIDETIDDDTIDVEITAFVCKGAVKSLIIRNSPAPSPVPDHKENISHDSNEKPSDPIITLEEALGNDKAALKDEEDNGPHELKNLEEPIENVLFEENKKDDSDDNPEEKSGNNIENSTQFDGMTEEEIAEALLERAEVLKGKAIGVDFHKLPPDSDLIRESKVLQAILDEKLIKPQKKLSTFLQLPKRPKLKSPKEIKPKGVPYLPLKYKGKKALQEAEEQEEKQKEEEVNEQIIEEENENIDEKHNNLVDEVVQTEEVEQEEEEQEEEIDPDDVDAQIGYIQKQLQFIMELPQAIQDNLKFLQDQLHKLATFRAGVNQENEPENEINEEENINEENNNNQEEIDEIVEEENNETHQEEINEMNDHIPEENLEMENFNRSEVATPDSDLQEGRMKKDIKWRREEEFVKNRPFFPLTPHPRPLILPGGRKWWKPKDIYDEEYLAETISSHEEILTGTTLGVNFNKFAKQYDYLKDSGVYQMIHGLDKDKRKAPFERRPSRIRAIQDYPKFENSESIQEE